MPRSRITRTDESLEQKLAPVFVCLSAEFERRQGFPLLISEDTEEGAQIENALHAERFEFFLQPICSLHDNVSLAHFEVLLRLRTANGSLIEPKEFLARAAQQRLMPNIDRWVVRTLAGVADATTASCGRACPRCSPSISRRSP